MKKYNFTFKYLLVSLFFLCKNIVVAQELQVTADKQEVGVGEPFQIKYSIQNLDMTGFTPPNFQNFEVIGAPSRQTSVQIVNGKATRSSAISYELRAKQMGRFTIGKAKVTLPNKRELYSTELQIAVTSAPKPVAPPTSGGRNDVFIRATLSTNEVYVGQQILLEYKVFTAVNISGAQLMHESDYKGFYHQQLTEYSRDDQTQIVGGKRYLVRTLGRIALFAQESGNLSIEPITMQVGILKAPDPRDPFGSIFSEAEAVQIASNAVSVNVKPLPAPLPTYFVGAVGRCEASASISKTQATTDDALSLRLTLTSNGDPKRIQAPQLLPVEGLTFYEPKILSEKTFEQNNELITIKEIEYLILPKIAKEYNFKPELAFFNLQKRDLEKFNLPTFALQIAQGTNSVAQISAVQQSELAPIKTATIFNPRTEGGQFTGSWLYWALLVTPFLIFMGVVGWNERQKRLSRIDENILKIHNAEKIARQRLALAKEMLHRKSIRGFYDEVSRSLYGYASDKLGIPPAEFSKETLREKLLAAQVRPDLVETVLVILKKCELALFAGGDTEGEAMQGVFEQTVKVVTDMEQGFKKMSS